MLLSLLKTAIVSPSLIPGFLALFLLSELVFVMLNLSTNALILLLAGLNVNLAPAEKTAKKSLADCRTLRKFYYTANFNLKLSFRILGTERL